MNRRLSFRAGGVKGQGFTRGSLHVSPADNRLPLLEDSLLPRLGLPLVQFWRGLVLSCDGTIMKTLTLISLGLFAALSGFAQGTVDFRNRVPGIMDAPIFDMGWKIEGPNAWAQLWAGPWADSLAPIGAPCVFRTGTGAGYWNPAPDSTRTIPTVTPGTSAFVQVRIWYGGPGSTYDSAWDKCFGAIFNVATGGAGSPPSLPGLLTGMQSFGWVPEPSTVALGLIGGVLFLLRWRR